MKRLASIHKLFSTTLADLLLFHIASYSPYDYYCFFFYLLDNLIILCLEMEEQKRCKDFEKSCYC